MKVELIRLQHLPFVLDLLALSQPVSPTIIIGTIGWTLMYMRGCSPYASSSVTRKVDAFSFLVAKELLDMVVQ